MSSRSWASTEEEAQEKFGFLLDAFKFGAPPHGGIAVGMDRSARCSHGTDSIRDVIAFPKSGGGFDPLTAAPAPITPAQRKEAGVDAAPERRDPTPRNGLVASVMCLRGRAVADGACTALVVGALRRKERSAPGRRVLRGAVRGCRGRVGSDRFTQMIRSASASHRVVSGVDPRASTGTERATGQPVPDETEVT